MPKPKDPSRTYPAARKYGLRTDSTVESALREMERVFKLPEGSVRLVLPSGRAARKDKMVGALLYDWEHRT